MSSNWQKATPLLYGKGEHGVTPNWERT